MSIPIPDKYINKVCNGFLCTHSIKQWKTLKEILDMFPLAGWLFRGQEDSTWGLKTSLERWIGKLQPKNSFMKDDFLKLFQKNTNKGDKLFKELIEQGYLEKVHKILSDYILTDKAKNLKNGKINLSKEFTQNEKDKVCNILRKYNPVFSEESIELRMLKIFEQQAHNYLPSSSMPTNILEWMAIMQHYGAPTRLLDMTASPYVASFFALEAALDKSKECSIYAVDAEWCRCEAIEIIKKEYKQDSDWKPFAKAKEHLMAQRLLNGKYFGELFFKSPYLLELVCPVKPIKLDKRMTIQQGWFLCPGNACAGFEENLNALPEFSKHIIKINISNVCRKDAMIDLNRMNINFATLFPGLDGFAKSLRDCAYLEFPG